VSELSSQERYLYQLFSFVEEGYLTVKNPRGDEFRFGNKESYPHLSLVIKNQNTYKHIIALAAFGLCESYMEGWWDEESDNLVELIGLLFKNNLYKKASGNLSLVLQTIAQRLLTLPIFIQNSRKNAQYHYDLGTDFYQLFLDKTLTYSCGYKIRDTDNLEEMQLQKYELICRKLALKPGEHIIDIGCGWGGMLIYAAEKYGIYGTGITLSQDQGQFAKELIEQKGLSERLNIMVSDYREIEGQYDKFVSIGMFEHVGKGNFSTFMKKTSELLKPSGVGVLQTIGTTGNVRIDPWVDKYIFPGGYLPQLHELTSAMQAVRFTVAHYENLKSHYAETLEKWAKNFVNNKDKIIALSHNFEQRFLRMWYLYLQSFETGFRYSNLQLYQLLFFKGKQWPFSTPLNFHIEKFL